MPATTANGKAGGTTALAGSYQQPDCHMHHIRDACYNKEACNGKNLSICRKVRTSRQPATVDATRRSEQDQVMSETAGGLTTSRMLGTKAHDTNKKEQLQQSQKWWKQHPVRFINKKSKSYG